MQEIPSPSLSPVDLNHPVSYMYMYMSITCTVHILYTSTVIWEIFILDKCTKIKRMENFT